MSKNNYIVYKIIDNMVEYIHSYTNKLESTSMFKQLVSNEWDLSNKELSQALKQEIVFSDDTTIGIIKIPK